MSDLPAWAITAARDAIAKQDTHESLSQVVAAALEASDAARVKAEQDAERLLTALDDHRSLLKCYIDEFGDVEISMEGFSMPTNTRAIKAEQERDVLKEALKPFAIRCGHYEPPHGELAHDNDMAHDCYATVGDLRAARRALESSK